jgi:hypothetical protein
MKTVWRNVAVMLLFTIIGLTQYTEGVRAVQVLGLFASGMVAGVSLALIIAAVKGSRKAS